MSANNEYNESDTIYCGKRIYNSLRNKMGIPKNDSGYFVFDNKVRFRLDEWLEPTQIVTSDPNLVNLLKDTQEQVQHET